MTDFNIGDGLRSGYGTFNVSDLAWPDEPVDVAELTPGPPRLTPPSPRPTLSPALAPPRSSRSMSRPRRWARAYRRTPSRKTRPQASPGTASPCFPRASASRCKKSPAEAGAAAAASTPSAPKTTTPSTAPKITMDQPGGGGSGVDRANSEYLDNGYQIDDDLNYGNELDYINTPSRQSSSTAPAQLTMEQIVDKVNLAADDISYRGVTAPTALIATVIAGESNGDSDAESCTGTKGLGQLSGIAVQEVRRSMPGFLPSGNPICSIQT